MALADELERLGALHRAGQLSDEEFARAKSRLLGGGAEPRAGGVDAVNRFRRSVADRWVAGVCGGIAAASGIESWIWRLVFAALAFFGGTGVLIYILLWIFVPEQGE